MENVLFGVQLCIKTSIFNEKSDFCYSDHPEITPGLILVSLGLSCKHVQDIEEDIHIVYTCVYYPKVVFELIFFPAKKFRKDL